MPKPLDQFGGWLRFFQIIAALNFFIAVFYIGMALVVVLDGSQLPGAMSQHQMSVAAIFAIPFAALMARLFLTISVPGNGTPAALTRLIWLAVGLIFLQHLADAWTIIAANPDSGFFEAFEWPRGIMWLLAFSVYLQQSKRVKAFYGANYPEKTADPYIKDPFEDMIEGWRNRPGQKK